MQSKERDSSPRQGTRGSRQGAVPLLATRLVDITLPGDILAMVSTHGKAVTRRSVGTQTEVLHKHTAVQVSGCRSA